MINRIVYLCEVPSSDGVPIPDEVPSSGEVRLFADEPDVMSVQRVAELLGVAPATIRREINRGNLECVHVGRCVRVTKAALVRYIGEQA